MVDECRPYQRERDADFEWESGALRLPPESPPARADYRKRQQTKTPRVFAAKENISLRLHNNYLALSQFGPFLRVEGQSTASLYVSIFIFKPVKSN